MKILLTGGTGFIGSAVIRRLIADFDHEVLNIEPLLRLNVELRGDVPLVKAKIGEIDTIIHAMLPAGATLDALKTL